MLKNPRMVRKVSAAIGDAVDAAFEAYRHGRVNEEPAITDRILGGVEERVRSLKLKGVAWTARTLRTARGRAAEERRHGADLMGVLDIEVPGFSVKKGFLAQAKRAEPGQSFSSADWNRLQEQCETMLMRSPDSFVLVYSKARGVRFVSASAVLHLHSRDIFDLYDRSVASFFEAHIECFIGDRRLDSTDINVLDAMLDMPVLRVLELKARS